MNKAYVSLIFLVPLSLSTAPKKYADIIPQSRGLKGKARQIKPIYLKKADLEPLNRHYNEEEWEAAQTLLSFYKHANTKK